MSVIVFRTDKNDDDGDDDDADERKTFAKLQLLPAITNKANSKTLTVEGYSDSVNNNNKW